MFMSSLYQLVFGDNHVMGYMGADDVAVDAGEA